MPLASTVAITPAALHGTAAAPPSKSAAHRALIGAALAQGGTVRGVLESADMCATLEAAAPLGVRFDRVGDVVTVRPDAAAGTGENGTFAIVPCRESGSTLRFLLPVFAARGLRAVFTGQGRLPQRPLDVYEDCLPAKGARLTRPAGGGTLPLALEGRLTGGTYALRGNRSSQFFSGLLFALPLCTPDSILRFTTPLESAPYVAMTCEALRRCGIVTEPLTDGWHIPGGQHYTPCDVTVEGDWSQAAFLLAAGAINGNVRVTELNPASVQGDRAILHLLRQFGAVTEETANAVSCRHAPLHGIAIDAAAIPDLVPILSVVAAAAKGRTVIYNAARLRLKESDRLAAMTACLRTVGVAVEERPDGLVIEGDGELHGAAAGNTVSGCNDHRVVMSMAVAALIGRTPLIIEDAHSVAKSWPEFFTVYQQLGGIVHVIDHR